MREYKVLILAAPSGHMTLAKAVRSFLEDIPGVSIRTIDLVGDNPEWDVFRFFYRYSPFMMKLPFLATRNPNILKIVKNTNVRRLKERLTSILDEEDPDLVITTYHGYIPIVDQLKASYRFKYVNPISDPVSLHPILFSRAADYNIGFDESSQEFGQNLMIPKEKIIPCGWFTARCFFESQPVDRIRKALGLQDMLTLMVCAGSEGNNAVLSLLPVLLFTSHPRPFQIIFVVGRNPQLAKTIRNYYQMASWLNPRRPGMALKGFTNRMHEYIAVSDVVIGKAGPNLIFESVARQKPFIAIAHISGNEDGNLRMIRKFNLGWVAENPFTAARLIKEIIEEPGMLQPKQRNLEEMSRKCYQGGMFLREKVLEWNKSQL